MQKNLIRPCPCCGCETAEILHPTKFVLIEAVPLVNSYDVVTCTRCGFAFADTASTQKEYDAYYKMHSKYEDATTATGSGLSPEDAKRLRMIAEHIATLVPDRATRIADIGCANGGLLAALKEIGYTDLTGIDPSPACVRNIAAQGGIAAMVGSFSQLPAVEKPFDLIIMTGVLEHVRDISDAIQALNALLTPSGQLYIAVPDAMQYLELLYAPFQEFNVEHINHFTVTSLKNFMQGQGYACLASGQQSHVETAGSESPVAYGLFTRSADTGEMVTDVTARQLLERYVAASQAMMDDLERQLAEAFKAHPKLILWGTGQLALKMLALPPVKAEQIVALVDSNPINQGQVLLGQTIKAPKDITDLHAPILLMTTLHHAPITEAIRNRWKMQNTVLTLHMPTRNAA